MRRTLMYVAVLSCFLAALRCSSPRLAGGSDNPDFKVSGYFVDSLGNSAENVLVKLVPGDFGPPSDTVISEILSDTTDASGAYCITTRQKGTYTVLSVDISQRTRGIVQDIAVQDTTTIVRTDTLRLPGSIRVILPPQVFGSGSIVVFIPGTDISVLSSLSSRYAVLDSVPAGTMASVCSVEPSNPASLATLAENVVVLPDASTLAGKAGWNFSRTLYLNTTAGGAAVSGSVYDFPVLIRLTKDNFDFNEAKTGGSDIRFAKPDGSPLSYEIEHWDASLRSAELWVKVDTVYGNDSTHFVAMYWGNPDATSSSNSAPVFDTVNGFQGVWHLSQIGTGPVSDATQNHYDGVSYNMSAASAVQGIVGGARKFDGATSYVSFPGTANSKLNLPEKGTYAVSAWASTANLDGNYHIIASKGNNQFSLEIRNSNSWEFAECRAAGGYTDLFSPASINTWSYLVGIRNGDKQYLYVNGTCTDSTITLLDTTFIRNTGDDFTIGKLTNGSSFYFNGMIDEVRVLNRPPSADWIKLCYMNQQAKDSLILFR